MISPRRPEFSLLPEKQETLILHCFEMCRQKWYLGTQELSGDLLHCCHAFCQVSSSKEPTWPDFHRRDNETSFVEMKREQPPLLGNSWLFRAPRSDDMEMNAGRIG